MYCKSIFLLSHEDLLGEDLIFRVKFHVSLFFIECEQVLQLYIAMTFHTGMSNGIWLEKLPTGQKETENREIF